MKKHRLKFVFTLVALLGVLLTPTFALATAHDGSGSYTPGGGGGDWHFDGPEWLKWFVTYPDKSPEYHSYNSGADGTTWTLPDNYEIGCYMYGEGDLYQYDWVTWNWLMPRIECTFYKDGAGRYLATELPKPLEKQANEDGYYLGADPSQPGLWYSPTDGRYLDAIYKTQDGTWKPGEWYHWKDVIVYQEEGTPGNMHTTIDCRDWSAEDKYNKAPTSSEYSHTTQPGDTTETYYIHTIVQTIKKSEWWWEYPDGSCDSWYLGYDIESNNEYNKTIHYGTSLPSVNQEYYTPLNANRQGYAEVGDCDITRNYVNGKKLDASVTNAQNRSNNSNIETLDLNADTNFTIKFNNDVLGLDASKNWNSSPPELKNGNWEYVEGTAYANGRILPGDDYYRYDLALNAAISTNITKSVDTASIVVNGHEYTASETYKSFVKNAPIRKIDASARFIYIGRYKLQSGITGAHFPNYWTATYNTATFFEYGVSYRGRITTSGIEAPQIVRGQGDVSQSGADNTIKTSYEKKQRGLYVGVKRQACQQPIVCATFNVKTVAGDLRD